MTKNAPRLRVRTLILGGGLSGLSAAYHLEKAGKTDYLLAEKNPFFGGLCASEEINGFTFDFSGHLLHLRDPYALALARKLLRGNLAKLKRKAFIHFDGKTVPFPFQANLWALPEDARKECLFGARQAAQKAQSARSKPKNFEEWCLRVFGAGIYKHFMRPYNQKLWRTDPKNLTWDWCGQFVPEPDLNQITAGARKKPRCALGYNAHFYYPLRGGCGALADALAAHVPNVWLNAEATQIDFKKKEALINGKTVQFEQLVNTLPLKNFVTLCNPPAGVKDAARRLRNTTVHVLNFAINRPCPGTSWIYFAQEDAPFYRVGVQSSFSPYNAPRGTASFYAETAAPITDFKAAQKAFFKALKQKGIIEKQDKILLSFWRTLPEAYAVYDHKRARAVQKIMRWLEQNRCICIGRYGRWEYSFMERSLLQGRDAAAKLL